MASILHNNKRRASLRDMRTAVTSRIRSKPTIEGQSYLDLYVLQRDRFRWKRLMDQAQRSIQSIDVALRAIGFEPEHLEPDQAGNANAKTGRASNRTINLGAATKQKRSA